MAPTPVNEPSASRATAGKENVSKNENSAFAVEGMARVIQRVCEEIRELYQWDDVPWVVGYSGGKDSSAVLQLIWLAIRDLPPENRQKPIHVISTDTLVEQPMVAAWVDASHLKMKKAAAEQSLPFTPHKLTPEIKDSFWVNLIGKGYPAPRKLFRWCTSRMKINPSNDFVRNVIRKNGEALLVLGTRKAESQRRGRQMESNEKQSRRAFLNERLTLNANLPNSRVYTPIEDWTNDDVWLFLMQVKNPWGHTNKSLLTMYQGASSDGECPLVVDSSTPSCGTSRFGCWVCTVVDKDRSMEAMIKNDDEKLWMTPLLELRNELGDFSLERSRRDYRRMHGRVDLFGRDEENLAIIRGPYTKAAREYWLRRLLEAQTQIRRLGPEEFRQIELISLAELQEIRSHWLYEKHEFDDSLPGIFEEITGQPFPKPSSDDNPLRAEDWRLLQEVCGEDQEFFELQASLLDIERAYRGMSRRAGIYERLEDRLKANQFRGEEEALAIRRDEERRRREAATKEYDPSGSQRKVVQQPLFEEGEGDEIARAAE